MAQGFARPGCGTEDRAADRSRRSRPLGRREVLRRDWGLRVDYGPGFRVYFAQRGPVLVILLCGGDKSSQDRDIETAKTMAKEL